MTAELLAEKILKIIYGGRTRTGNDQITPRQVMLAVQVARDAVVGEVLRADSGAGKPLEDAMFTRFDEILLLWDAKRDLAYAELPFGYMSLPYDKSIRPIPMKGRNLFRRIPPNYADMSPELGNLDGIRIPWYVTPPMVGGLKRLYFPTLPKPEGDYIVLDVIIGDSRLLAGSQVGIPSDLVDEVETRVLRKYRPYINDKANDGRSQA